MAVQLKILLGNAIKSTRSALGISQEELAARAGLHRTYVSDVERGARNPSLESVEKLARALELSLPRLLERAGDTQTLVEILLVEDEPGDIELTMRAFQKARLTNPIHVARDGLEALEFLFARGRHAGRGDQPLPKVVLLDLNLPQKSGIEVLRQIKNDQRTRDIAVVVLTGSKRDRDINECRRLGAETYIVKPVDFQNFSEVTSQLKLAWTLVQPASNGAGKIGSEENRMRAAG
jgi:two-component system, response regulator